MMHQHLYTWVCSRVPDFPKMPASGNWISAIFGGSPQIPSTLVQSSYLSHVQDAHYPQKEYETWTSHQSIVAFLVSNLARFVVDGFAHPSILVNIILYTPPIRHRQSHMRLVRLQKR